MGIKSGIDIVFLSRRIRVFIFRKKVFFCCLVADVGFVSFLRFYLESFKMYVEFLGYL